MKLIRTLTALLLPLLMLIPCGAAYFTAPADYDYTGSFYNGFAVVSRGGKWGAVNAGGTEIYPVSYESLADVPVVLPPEKPASSSLYSEGLAVTQDAKTGLYGYTDTAGHVVAKAVYDYAAPFSNGFGRVMRGGLWGFVDANGCEVIPPVYHYARDFDQVGAWVQVGTQRMLVSIEYARICSKAFSADGSLYALPSVSSLTLSGREISLEAYEIGGSNYVKLRDVAMLMNSTAKRFSVGWDPAAQAVSVTTGAAYTPVGGELAGPSKTSPAAVFSPVSVLWNGREMAICAYEIGGNNFFKLRDLMALLNVWVGWDAQSQRITLDPSGSYVGAAPAEKLPARQLPSALLTPQQLYESNPAGQIQCLYGTAEYLTLEAPKDLYGIGVLDPVERFDPSRDEAGHIAALDAIVGAVFGLSFDEDGVLRKPDGTACLSLVFDGERPGLTIGAWRFSPSVTSGGAPYQNAALEVLQYLADSDELGAALWSLTDALQLGLGGTVGDFGFIDAETHGLTGILTYRTGQRVSYDLTVEGQITFRFL